MNDTAISRDTFQDEDILNKLKHYVGVRLQQGVPLVDADWNEQEDIRRFEVEAFLKWYVGNGVPKGNNGFKIVSTHNKIILILENPQLREASIEVKLNKSTANEILGFDNINNFAKRMGPTPVQLTGQIAAEGDPAQFEFGEGKKLVLSIDGAEDIEISFLGSMTPELVASTIQAAVGTTHFKSIGGAKSDFDIEGGDGTFKNPGRCLVEGWEVINEACLRYGSQPYNIKEFEPTPGAEEIYIAYLDIWEREVKSDEDSSMINEAIGVESCFRIKREWVCKVVKSNDTNIMNDIIIISGHVYYPIAELIWSGEALDIRDLRHTVMDLIGLGEEITDLQDEVYKARGSAEDLDSRLSSTLTSEGFLKGSIVFNENISDDALVEERKLSFNSNGHDHSGDTQGKSIGENGILDNAITENKIEDGAVTFLKISEGAVRSRNINGSAVGKDKIANNAVNYYKTDHIVIGEGSFLGIQQNETKTMPIADMAFIDPRPYWLIIRPIGYSSFGAAVTGELLFLSHPAEENPFLQGFQIWVSITRKEDLTDEPVDVYYQIVALNTE